MGRYSLVKNSSIVSIFVILSNENNKRALKMALDTGATYTTIPWETAQALGLKPEISIDNTDMITSSGIERAPLLTIKEMIVLDKKAENVKVIVHDLPQRSQVDGLLGLSFLKHFKVTLNFNEGYLEIE